MTVNEATAVVDAMATAAPDVRNLPDPLRVQLIDEVRRIPMTERHALQVIYGFATTRRSGQRFAAIGDLTAAMKKAARIGPNPPEPTPEPQRGPKPLTFAEEFGHASPYHFFAADPERMERDLPEWFTPIPQHDGTLRARVETRYFLDRVQAIRNRRNAPSLLKKIDPPSKSNNQCAVQ